MRNCNTPPEIVTTWLLREFSASFDHFRHIAVALVRHFRLCSLHLLLFLLDESRTKFLLRILQYRKTQFAFPPRQPSLLHTCEYQTSQFFRISRFCFGTSIKLTTPTKMYTRSRQTNQGFPNGKCSYLHVYILCASEKLITFHKQFIFCHAN